MADIDIDRLEKSRFLDSFAGLRVYFLGLISTTLDLPLSLIYFSFAAEL